MQKDSERKEPTPKGVGPFLWVRPAATFLTGESPESAGSGKDMLCKIKILLTGFALYSTMYYILGGNVMREVKPFLDTTSYAANL